MKVFVAVHATHPTFLSLIFHSSPQSAVVTSVEREKNWNQIPAFNNAPSLDLSSDRDTNPDVQFLLQTVNSANPETEHFPSRNVLLDTHFCLGFLSQSRAASGKSLHLP